MEEIAAQLIDWPGERPPDSIVQGGFGVRAPSHSSFMRYSAQWRRAEMRKSLIFMSAIGALLLGATAAQADSQSSNTSSNSSSNNGVVRDRVVDTYCEDGYCERSVSRRTYRDDDGYRGEGRRWGYRDGKRYRKYSRTP